MLRRALIAALCLGPAASASAQDRTVADDCGAKAALYASEKGLKLWAVRRGTLAMGENPLRPLSQEEFVVLQVVVNGRIATAFGPDPDNLRQGGAPQQVEREGVAPIRWSEGGRGYPDAIRVVAEDGTVLLGPMRFGGCEDAPAAKAVAAPARRSERPARDRKPGPAPGRDDSHLPQGALSSPTLPGAPPR